MLLKNLEYLEAVYRHKNFTKAAEELFVSQPAISTAIRRLEEELGVKLIERTNKAVAFTQEGECFMGHVFQILGDVRSAKEAMQDLNANRKQVLRLGLSPCTEPLITEHLFSRFMPALSNNETIFVDENGVFSHIAKLQGGELDIAYNACCDTGDPDIQCIPLMKTEMCLMMREDHPLSQLEKIPFRQLSRERIVTMDEATFYYHCLTQECTRRGFIPQIVSKHTHMSTYLNTLASGGCVGLFNISDGQGLDRQISARRLVTRPFVEYIGFDMGFLMKKDHYISQLAKKFMAFIEDELRDREDHRFHTGP